VVDLIADAQVKAFALVVPRACVEAALEMSKREIDIGSGMLS
jgi:hypothetical protein